MEVGSSSTMMMISMGIWSAMVSTMMTVMDRRSSALTSSSVMLLPRHPVDMSATLYRNCDCEIIR